MSLSRSKLNCIYYKRSITEKELDLKIVKVNAHTRIIENKEADKKAKKARRRKRNNRKDIPKFCTEIKEKVSSIALKAIFISRTELEYKV
ncbi:28069_t:CDS:2 [Gigaspora margarita]|uniref:28069_t:CDS:1 n=1 Tax=Gigaspora margarita TaxID=4874 RepID=A0ABN7UI54_GIGMA|nr:28069_t:CDS:2 [Gigaspora margarita]